jgi:hypothetical protein
MSTSSLVPVCQPGRKAMGSLVPVLKSQDTSGLPIHQQKCGSHGDSPVYLQGDLANFP